MSRRSVINFLRGPVPTRVRFTIPTNNGNLSVDGSTFRRVADAIDRGSVHLTVVEQSQMPSSGAGALYYSAASTSTNAAAYPTPIQIAANSLYCQPLHGRVQEGMLIHEAVHASLDLTRSGGILTVWDEAACYIAEILYSRRMGLSRSRITSPSRVAAMPAVEEIIATGSATTASLNSLYAAIKANPLYTENAGVCYVRNG